MPIQIVTGTFVSSKKNLTLIVRSGCLFRIISFGYIVKLVVVKG